MKNLVKEYLKDKFFENKDEVISKYLTATGESVKTYNYTKGKAVIIANERAYSKNGYFFSVILKNEDYIQNIVKENIGDVVVYFDEKFGQKYEEEIEDEEEIEVEE